jgi:hypothetical protein
MKQRIKSQASQPAFFVALIVASPWAMAIGGCSEEAEIGPPSIVVMRAVGSMPAAGDIPSDPKASGNDSFSSEDKRMLNELLVLGYVEGSNLAPEESLVTVHREELSYPGPNLMVSGHGPEAILFDMQGQVLHRWSKSYQEAFPGSTRTTWFRGERYWRRAYLYENGDLLAIFDGLGLIKIDKDSNLLWATNKNNHHDLFVAPAGAIYSLAGIAKLIPSINETELVLEDFIVVFSPDGNEIKRVSLLQALLDSEYHGWMQYARNEGDIFHTNTIEVFDGALTHLSPHYRKGNVLISIHGLDAIGIVDMKAKKVVWGMRGPFKLQHQPTLLDNGNILIFDNLGGPEKFSQVLEIEPKSGEIVWSYRGSAPGEFYTFCCGTSQRLSNGNTLITDTAGGTAFEVTRDKQIVWQFRSPYRTGAKKERVASLFEVERLRPGFPLDWAAGGE